jgi:hypothetical protein
MAKATVSGGPSATEHEMSDGGPLVFTRPELGLIDHPNLNTPVEDEEEIQSQHNQVDGTDSSPSSKKEQSPTEPNTPNVPAPAPTTENPSEPPEMETDSTAPSTDGNGQSEPQRQSSRPRKAAARKAANPRAARVRSADEEFDEFEE